MEKLHFKQADIVFERASQVGIKAVNQVLLQEFHSLHLWLTVSRRGSRQHRVDLRPHLGLRKHVNQRVKQLARHHNLVHRDLVIQLLRHQHTCLLLILTREVLQGATKLFTGFLSDWELC